MANKICNGYYPVLENNKEDLRDSFNHKNPNCIESPGLHIKISIDLAKKVSYSQESNSASTNVSMIRKFSFKNNPIASSNTSTFELSKFNLLKLQDHEKDFDSPNNLNNINLIKDNNESNLNNFTLQGTGFFPEKACEMKEHDSQSKVEENLNHTSISFAKEKCSLKNLVKHDTETENWKNVAYTPPINFTKNKTKTSEKNENSFLKQNHNNIKNQRKEKKNSIGLIEDVTVDIPVKPTCKPLSSKAIHHLDKISNNKKSKPKLEEITNRSNKSKFLKETKDAKEKENNCSKDKVVQRSSTNYLKVKTINSKAPNTNRNTNKHINNYENLVEKENKDLKRNKNVNLERSNRGLSARPNFSTFKSKSVKNNENIKIDLNNLVNLCNDPNLFNQEPIILEKIDNILDNLTDIKNVITDNKKKKASKSFK